MMNFNHPFLLKMHGCFQNDKKLYLITDHCEKGDLGRYLKLKGRLTEVQAKMLISEVILAVEALHSQNFMHRDIKPENVLVTDSGHIKLADYGMCKELKQKSDLTSTFCGSMMYLAPEIVNREAYGKSVDWFLVGELLYECVYG